MNNPPVGVASRERKRAIVWKAASVAWAGLIFYLSTETFGGALTASFLGRVLDLLHIQVSLPVFEALHFLMRKGAHLTEYAVFALLLYGSIEGPRPYDWRRRRALGSIGIAALYSLTDEFHQRFVPGRGPSLVDCGIDTVGAAIAMLILYARRWMARP